MLLDVVNTLSVLVVVSIFIFFVFAVAVVSACASNYIEE